MSTMTMTTTTMTEPITLPLAHVRRVIMSELNILRARINVPQLDNFRLNIAFGSINTTFKLPRQGGYTNNSIPVEGFAVGLLVAMYSTLVLKT